MSMVLSACWLLWLLWPADDKLVAEPDALMSPLDFSGPFGDSSSSANAQAYGLCKALRVHTHVEPVPPPSNAAKAGRLLT